MVGSGDFGGGTFGRDGNGNFVGNGGDFGRNGNGDFGRDGNGDGDGRAAGTTEVAGVQQTLLPDAVK